MSVQSIVVLIDCFYSSINCNLKIGFLFKSFNQLFFSFNWLIFNLKNLKFSHSQFWFFYCLECFTVFVYFIVQLIIFLIQLIDYVQLYFTTNFNWLFLFFNWLTLCSVVLQLFLIDCFYNSINWFLCCALKINIIDWFDKGFSLFLFIFCENLWNFNSHTSSTQPKILFSGHSSQSCYFSMFCDNMGNEQIVHQPVIQ